MTFDTSKTFKNARFSARCYCGCSRLTLNGDPEVVAYCHCADCRRWTGSPLPAFAAFRADALHAEPPLPEPLDTGAGAQRWHCPTCGSPLVAAFDYLPDQVYVPLGVIEQAAQLSPSLHCHAEQSLPWLHLPDGLDRQQGSARDLLRATSRSNSSDA